MLSVRLLWLAALLGGCGTMSSGPAPLQIWKDGHAGPGLVDPAPAPGCTPVAMVDTTTHSADDTASYAFSIDTCTPPASFAYAFQMPTDVTAYQDGRILFNLRSDDYIGVTVSDPAHDWSANLGDVGFTPDATQFQPVSVPIRHLTEDGTTGNGPLDFTMIAQIKMTVTDGTHLWIDDVRWSPN